MDLETQLHVARYIVSVNLTRKDLHLNLANAYFLSALNINALKLFSVFTFIPITGGNGEFNFSNLHLFS